ncbi:anthranilate phosphoribosyltransferase [Propionibacteriaceae bacterium Y2011]
MSAGTSDFTRRRTDLLTALVRGEDLDAASTQWVMDQVLAGDLTPVQLAGFAVALRTKGETADEIRGMSDGMLAHSTPITVPGRTVDIVGTGGDRANTVNVSTMAGLVAAGAGARVVKHGNRAASSACGAADVIEALGVALDTAPERQAGVLEAAGICFLFAPQYHPSLRHAAVARKELGIATTFNLLGPLSNPARPQAQALGIADLRVAEMVAGVMASRGAEGLVFHGGDGLDELTTTTSSTVFVVTGGAIRRTELDPRDLGIARATPDDLVGGDPAHNAQVVRDLLAGAPGPVRDIVVLNAAAALLAYAGPDLEADLVGQLTAHVDAAGRALDSGAAATVLQHWVAATAG